MLQNYKFPVTNVIYTKPDNSQVKVIYADNTFNWTDPEDSVVISWVGMNANTISAYVAPQEDPDLDKTQTGYVGISEETPEA